MICLVNFIIHQPCMLCFVASIYLMFLSGDSIFTVMLMGTLLYGVKYTFPEYLCTFLVAGGVSSFALLKVRFVHQQPYQIN